MRAVDTNVLLRLITADDPRQTSIAESFVRNGAWVSTLALAEVVWVLGTVYKLPASAQATAIEMLLHHSDLVLQDADTVTTALELFRAKPVLGFSDCPYSSWQRKRDTFRLARSTGASPGSQEFRSCDLPKIALSSILHSRINNIHVQLQLVVLYLNRKRAIKMGQFFRIAFQSSTGPLQGPDEQIGWVFSNRRLSASIGSLPRLPNTIRS